MSESTTFRALISTFTTFLTVAIHTILYERNIYPLTSFLSARKYSFAVRQSRHPRVCQWITDAVSAIETELLKCAVERVAVVIFDPQDRAVERFMFDTSRLPIVPAGQQDMPLERTNEKGEKVAVMPVVDLEEQFRATMSRLSGCGSSLKSVAEGSTFSIAVELRDESEPPIGHPQPWIPVQPPLQKTIGRDADGEKQVNKGEEVGGASTTPIRSVAAGEMLFEVWIEESTAKLEQHATTSSAESRSRIMPRTDVPLER